METQAKQFSAATGSNRLNRIKYLVILFSLAGFSVLVIGRIGLAGAVGLMLLPFLFFYLYRLYRDPSIGLWSAIILGFVLLGTARYISYDLKIGLGLDIVLVLTYIALIMNRFYERVDWRPAKKDVTLLAFIWFCYSILQFFNPEVQSHAAWLSGMRGISLYMMMVIPLALLFITDKKKLDVFLLIWGIFSILVTIKGIIQMTLGPDPWEQLWLNSSEGQTHIIFGHLRAFSFLSDAGQFGANQAYTGVVMFIVALSEKSRKRKLFYLLVAFLGFIGMVISGTRGAISIPIAGFALFLVLRKSGIVLVTGIVLLALLFVFFKFTYIGQSNQYIRRMRSAFNPNDPSLQVRLENQKKLMTYLSSRPFGGGIGHAGVKAREYTPGSYLSGIATDSWYVLIWAEQGVVGLAMHLFILFYILIKGSWLIMYRIRDRMLKHKMAALASGMMGVMVASYGNAVLGTMPTSLLIYTSMALLLNSGELDKENIPGQPGYSSGNNS
jgi:hypothetical protein